MHPLLRRRRPCPHCPFRRDLVGEVAFPNLAEYAAGTCVQEDGSGPAFGGLLFGCHMDSVESARLCAGWLAVEGHAHPSVRAAVSLELLPVEALTSGEGWPDLFSSATEMIKEQAYDAYADLSHHPTPEESP